MALENRRAMVTKEKLERIGDAIREKSGTTKEYKLDDMPNAIRNISGGGGGGGAFVISAILEPNIVMGDYSFN